MAPAATPPPQPTFQIGDQVGDSKQYTIQRLIGKGGFGEVYLAWEPRIDQRQPGPRSRDRRLLPRLHPVSVRRRQLSI